MKIEMRFPGIPGTASGSDRGGWGSRRVNKQTKIELLEAQQALQSEIRAKQQLLEELKKIRSAYLTTKQRLDESDKQVVMIFIYLADQDDIYRKCKQIS